MKEIYLIVGLGNPGPEYESTRHNTGFLFIEHLKSKKKIFLGKLFRNRIYEAYELIEPPLPDCIVAKPFTFMNRSGIAVNNLVREFDIPTKNIIVVHDELDIELGRMKFKFGGSDAGHRGIKSIIMSLGTREFYRLRIGIGRPAPEEKVPIREWVLSPFKDFEFEILQKVLDGALEGLSLFFLKGEDRAINFINGFRVS